MIFHATSSAEIKTNPPNRKLPSVKALQQQYDCAQGTAEHAIRVLKAEGLVKSVKGKGVYVI